MKFDKLKFVVLLYWRGSALAFPSGEGGTANAVTEEVYRQYVFSKTLVITQLFTAPLPPPFGGYPIYYVRLPPAIVYPMGFALVQRGGL